MLHEGEGGSKWPILVLHNLWTAPYRRVQILATFNMFKVALYSERIWDTFHTNVPKGKAYPRYEENPCMFNFFCQSATVSRHKLNMNDKEIDL